MFRCREAALGPDPSFEANLSVLGFFVNKLGQIRKIEEPSEHYTFYVTNNERVNEVFGEAMQVCEREEVNRRLAVLEIAPIFLPDFSTIKPTSPHIPILAPSPQILQARKRVIVLVNDSSQDLAILAYRQLRQEPGVNGGSVINFVKEIILRSAAGDAVKTYQQIFQDGFAMESENHVPALIVMNTGQLLYSHKFNKSMTWQTWRAMPRKSSAHDTIQIHEQENHVGGHKNPKEHVRTVFNDVLFGQNRVAPNAEIYLIAIADGAAAVLDVLAENVDYYRSRIAAIAMVNPLVDSAAIKDPHLMAFLHRRARQWKFCTSTGDPGCCTDLPKDYHQNSDHTSLQHSIDRAEFPFWTENVKEISASSLATDAFPKLVLDGSLSGDGTADIDKSNESIEWSTDQAVLCPTFGGGMSSFGECAFTEQTVQRAILSFFEDVAQDPAHYCNPAFQLHQQAPQPTPENPLELSADDHDYSTLPREMTPERTELEEQRRALCSMREALAACPEHVSELEKGRQRLIKRIQAKETTIEELEKRALASGGLGAGVAVEKRENWKPLREGEKVAFAGTVVDSELLKAAGLLDTAKEQLEKVEDDEKAFL